MDILTVNFGQLFEDLGLKSKSKINLAFHIAGAQLEQLDLFEYKQLYLWMLDYMLPEPEEIPKDVKALLKAVLSLKSLYLSGCNLDTLPKNLDLFINLRYLYLNDNAFKTLPKQLFKLQKLEELHLGGNPLKGISGRILDLPKLQSLYVDNLTEIGIRDLSFLWMKTDWKTLGLDGLNIAEIPKGIYAQDNLKELYLEMNKVQVLGEEIAALTNLEYLNLRWNNLRYLHENIAKLKCLKSLNLSYNQLTSIPESILELKNLEHLYLHGNPLSVKSKGILKELGKQCNVVLV